MKLITAFGLVSALLLLSVSTILVVKQNRTDDLAPEDFECLEYTYGYNPNFYVPYLIYFTNTCQQVKKFSIVYDNNSYHTQIVTSCLSQNEKFQKNILTKTTIIYSVQSSQLIEQFLNLSKNKLEYFYGQSVNEILEDVETLEFNQSLYYKLNELQINIYKFFKKNCDFQNNNERLKIIFKIFENLILVLSKSHKRIQNV